MDYLSQKIKSAPKIECSLGLHKRIMRRALYEQLRYPLWILIAIVSTRIVADVWQILNHSFTKVLNSFIESFGISPSGIAHITQGIAAKAMLHPDLLAALIIDFCLISFIMYMLNVVKRTNTHVYRGKLYKLYLYPTLWLKQVGRMFRIAS